ncbi:MAG TPA: iron-containing redox enzyme family protein [Motiliproteus sp.]
MPFYDQLMEATARERDALFTLPVVRQTLGGEVSLVRYRAFLAQAYHHVRHTVPLMMSCGARLGDSHPELLPALRAYIDEEIGHEQWILNDIRAAGGDPDSVSAAEPSYHTELMVAYAYDAIARRHALAFFGMVLVLEGTSTALATEAAAVVQRQLDLPDAAFSYLRSHGELDQSHAQYFKQLMNRITATEDQAAIIHAARRFYRLYGDLLNHLPY